MADTWEPLGGLGRGSPRTVDRGERKVSARQPIFLGLKEGIEDLPKLYSQQTGTAASVSLASGQPWKFQAEGTVQKA